jgi:hypothetical protein
MLWADTPTATIEIIASELTASDVTAEDPLSIDILCLLLKKTMKLLIDCSPVYICTPAFLRRSEYLFIALKWRGRVGLQLFPFH